MLRKSARARIPIDYQSLDNGSAVPVQSATNKMYHPYFDKILDGGCVWLGCLLRKSARARIPIDYQSLDNGSAVPVQSATNKMHYPYVDKILNGGCVVGMYIAGWWVYTMGGCGCTRG